MSKKEKKEPLKKRDPYKFHRNRYYALKTAQYTVPYIPLITIFLIKMNEYIEVYEGKTVKFTVGCVIAFIVAVITAIQQIKKEEGPSSPVTTACGWGVAFLLSYLFYEIIGDITLILGCEFAGQCASATLDYVKQSDKQYVDAYKSETIKAKAQAQVAKEIADDGTRA